MRLTFCIRYDTAAGESLDVVVDGRPTLMTWGGDGWWSAQVTTFRGARYHYRVMRAATEVAAEGTSRVSPAFAEDAGTAVDRWRRPDRTDTALTSALFRNALAARHGEAVVGPPRGISFTVLASEVPPGHRPGIIGAGPALGEWDPAAVIPLRPAPFPWWRASVTAAADSLAGSV
ncbi:MAG: hypothetical protein M3349_08500 [Actinomycetota bacterium]|nr:hypothetical protein [Actinomycetota bacterium]